jgi:putative peptide zinc metalloprotease protein
MAQALPQTTPTEAGGTSPAAAQAARPPADPEVPERPALAPGVGLIGQMEGTGFKERQWLVMRAGRFLQVTELVYRILEQTTGERTLPEIAVGVTQSTDWEVSAEQVRYLLKTRLIPGGLVATADGSAVPPAGGRPRSALQVHLRTRLIGPRVLDPLSSVLQLLYAPPLAIPLLAAIAIAHWWSYFVHGVGDGLRAALSEPGGLLVVLGLGIVAGLFHELGHAAALRYGGGRPRGIGAALYWIYPVFYCDVTDSYRLGRGARLRTDVGGIYFHLISALVAVVLYRLTGYEFLLAMVPLITLLVLREWIPFMRLDGYWVLADLTGVPDFFSQMGPFLRSLLPMSVAVGNRLPPLRRWVKVVFAVYMVATIPMLFLLCYVLVAGVPYAILTTWQALLRQIELFSDGQRTGDVLRMATTGVQMLLLALPALGSVYLLLTLGRGLARAIWLFSKPTPARRLSGAVVTFVIGGLLASLWAPVLSWSPSPIPPEGVQSFAVAERSHVQRPVLYPHNPPVGGNHAPVWQNCGFYDTAIPNEQAVHALEHGAVWITYRPDLSADQVEALHRLSRAQTYLLVSPYAGLPAPVVASAWGKQLRLDSAADPRLGRFVAAFRLGPQAPEAGGPCTDGVGAPR